MKLAIVDAPSFVVMVRSLVAIAIPSNSPFIFVVVASFDMVAIRISSSLISTPVRVVLTLVDKSVVLISSLCYPAPPPAYETAFSTYILSEVSRSRRCLKLAT